MNALNWILGAVVVSALVIMGLELVAIGLDAVALYESAMQAMDKQ